MHRLLARAVTATVLTATLALLAVAGCHELPAADDRSIASSANDDGTIANSTEDGLITSSLVGDMPQSEIVDATFVPNSTEPFPTKTVRNYRDFVGGVRVAAPCPPDYRVAFTALGNTHVSAAGLTLLGYGTTITNVGGGWIPGGGSFVAPCRGVYSFTSTFVKDSYYWGGTIDDVHIVMTKNGSSVGFAWSGEGAGRRGTGTHTVHLLLNIGDVIQTYASSDGGVLRHLSLYEFTGALIRE